MANEVLKLDANTKPVIGLVTDDASQEIRMGRIDDTTKGLKVMLIGGTGTGTVTSISQSTGITLTPNPIVSTGTIALANTAVTAGTYTLATITVDAQGRITSASSGSAPGTGTVTSVSVTTANGVSGSVATATTTPAITLTLGDITPSKVNGLTITTSSGTLTIANAKTLNVTNTLTLSGTDSTIMTFPSTSATIARTDAGQTFTGTNAFGVITATTVNGNTFTAGTYTLTGQAGKTLTFNGSITLTGTDAQTYTFPTTSATLARTDAANTFTGTQTIGALVATTVNGNTFTTGTGVLTIAAAKTLTISNTMTLAGGDSTSITFPNAAATMARTDAAQTFTGTQTFSQTILTANAIAASGNAATVPVTSGRNIVTNNSAATLTITLTTASAVNMQTCIVQVLDSSAATQTITWVNTENSSVGVPTTSNGSTSLPLTVGFIYNASTSKWRCISSA